MRSLGSARALRHQFNTALVKRIPTGVQYDFRSSPCCGGEFHPLDLCKETKTMNKHRLLQLLSLLLLPFIAPVIQAQSYPCQYSQSNRIGLSLDNGGDKGEQ